MTDFWDVHGIFFILFMCFFPRLTMLLATSYVGGLLYWLGWLLLPRLTVAILATTFYWETNTILVVLTWLWALGGETTEKKAVRHKTNS